MQSPRYYNMEDRPAVCCLPLVSPKPGGHFFASSHWPTAVKESTDSVHKEKENKEYDDNNIGIIIGALAALIFLLVVVIVIFFVRQKRRKHNNNRRSLKPVVDRHVTINLNDLRGSTNGKVSNGNMYNSIATEETDSEREMRGEGGEKLSKAAYLSPKDSIQGRQLPPVPFSPACASDSAELGFCNPYAVVDGW